MAIQFRGGISDVLVAPIGGAFTSLAARVAPLVLAAASALGLADCGPSEADRRIRSPGTAAPLPPVDGGVRDSAVYRATGCFDPREDHFIEVSTSMGCSRFRIMPPGLAVQSSVSTFDVPLLFASNPGTVSGIGGPLTTQLRDRYRYNLQVVSYQNLTASDCSFRGVISYAGNGNVSGVIPFPLFSPYTQDGQPQNCRGDSTYSNMSRTPLEIRGRIEADFSGTSVVVDDATGAQMRYFHQPRPAR